VTVSGTHVALMAATLAKGTTVINNAACEPEIADVADCLNKMGARITGAGTPRIVVEGVEKLHGARHTVLPDRIEAGTYAMAVAMTGGEVQLAGARPELLQSALDVLTRGGRRHRRQQEGIRVVPQRRRHPPGDGLDRAVPRFPDRPAGAADGADGLRRRSPRRSPRRFSRTASCMCRRLARFGAKISLDGETATIDGTATLRGAPVMATDLRASVSLVIAGLAAEGETMVNRIYHSTAALSGWKKIVGLRRVDPAHQRLG
jgi:UDP-N-acetylglucosamine 1-carboxyvinyltransferase